MAFGQFHVCTSGVFKVCLPVWGLIRYGGGAGFSAELTTGLYFGKCDEVILFQGSWKTLGEGKVLPQRRRWWDRGTSSVHAGSPRHQWDSPFRR